MPAQLAVRTAGAWQVSVTVIVLTALMFNMFRGACITCALVCLLASIVGSSSVVPGVRLHVYVQTKVLHARCRES